MFLARGYGAKKLNIWVLPFCQADWMNPVSYFPLNTVWLWSTYQSYKIQPMSLPNANVYILVQQGKESNALFLIFLCHVCCHYLLAVCAHHPNLTSLSYFHFRKINSFIGGFDTNESYKLKPDWESFITSNRHILHILHALVFFDHFADQKMLPALCTHPHIFAYYRFHPASCI